MAALVLKVPPRPKWWLQFIDAYPAVPTVVAVTGLALLMCMLAPSVARPSSNGRTIDSLTVIVKSDAVLSKVVALRTAYHDVVPSEVRYYVAEILLNPALYLVVPFLLLLEYLFPCHPSQPLIGKGLLQDAVWFVAAAPAKVLLLGVASGFLQSVYDRHLAFLTIDSAVVWPRFLQLTAALVVMEFLFWMSHAVRHKVLSFWFFHAVHHSQKEMNAFTDDRNHVLDSLVSSLLRFIPFYVFQVPNLYAVAIVTLYMSIHGRFVHTNTKINLGWLGLVVVSPQFHRVHHSTAPAHMDKNFAGVLSIFDYAFGTAYPSREIYPETGIGDARFPTEDKARIAHLPKNWLQQNIFPFVQCFQRFLSPAPKVVDKPVVSKPRANKDEAPPSEKEADYVVSGSR